MALKPSAAEPSTVTYYVVLPFSRAEGDLVVGEAMEMPNEGAARRRAEATAAAKGGAVAFSRTGNPALGEFQDAVILGRYGDVPADLAEFTG